MTDHGEQLREAFETHEHQTPDPAAVYARVQELSRTYRRRRRGAQAAGGAVLGVGLIAGAVNFPGLLPTAQGGEGIPAAVAPAAATSPVPSAFSAPPPVSARPSKEAAEKDAADDYEVDPRQRAWDAYFGAGYGYDEAVRLAELWKSREEIGDVKAEAGRRLLAGQELPIKPSQEGVDRADDAAALDAFFAAGYDYNDAVKLARLWKSADPFEAKIEAGEMLLEGKRLPFAASANEPVDNGEGDVETARVEAFFEAGYDYDDAVELAGLWKKATPYDAKVAGGKLLLAGKKLPIQP